MEPASGVSLALLEGMDEILLARLHEAEIRTRETLGERLATAQARRALATELGVAENRLEALHHLNFVAPERQAGRLFDLERRLDDRFLQLQREQRIMQRILVALALALGLMFAVGVVLVARDGTGPAVTGDPQVEAMVDRLELAEAKLDALRPLIVRQVEARLMGVTEELGPAPGWSGPLTWTHADHRDLTHTLEALGGGEREIAVSLALLRLAEVENTHPDSLSLPDRARAAAALAAEFPAPARLENLWDTTAILLRERLRSRALGLAPANGDPPPPEAAHPWPWTSPGFLTAEELIVRVESLPVRENALGVWSESLGALRRAADVGREDLGAAAEASARDYWIRRAELEIAVVAAALGRPTLLPYHGSSPRAFLGQRAGYLRNARNQAAGSARAALSWLLVEYLEARRLVDRLAEHPEARDAARGKRWVEAMTALEETRPGNGTAPDRELLDAVGEALRASGVSVARDPWRHPRTRWEAGLRPLLMETRAAGRTPPDSSPDSP